MSNKAKGLMKSLRLSAEMSKFINKSEASRIDVTRALWAHIKQNNLQLPENKRMIKVDQTLKPIFPNLDQLSMFQIPKEINRHFKKEESE